jgi:hypothetical protein
MSTENEKPNPKPSASPDLDGLPTHCIDCNRRIKQPQKAKIKINFRRCSDCHKYASANYCNFWCQGRQCRHKAEANGYCVAHSSSALPDVRKAQRRNPVFRSYDRARYGDIPDPFTGDYEEAEWAHRQHQKNRETQQQDQANPHEIVGVSVGASISDIRSAFKRRALLLHPDKNRERDTTAAFQQLTAAYEILVEAASSVS